MKTLEKLLYWLLGLFVVFLIIAILQKILGGSLGFEEIVVGLLIADLGYVMGLHSRISNLNAKLSEHIGWHKGKGDSS
ncbi:MAG: hypothetical protein AABX29_00255 [Nanoarchaeota archaeon]